MFRDRLKSMCEAFFGSHPKEHCTYLNIWTADVLRKKETMSMDKSKNTTRSQQLHWLLVNWHKSIAKKTLKWWCDQNTIKSVTYTDVQYSLSVHSGTSWSMDPHWSPARWLRTHEAKNYLKLTKRNVIDWPLQWHVVWAVENLWTNHQIRRNVGD